MRDIIIIFVRVLVILTTEIMLIFVAGVRSQININKSFQDGEILQYRVSWAFLRLGTITLAQYRADSYNSDMFWLTMKAESNPIIPFVDVYFIDSSLVNRNDVRSTNFFQRAGRSNEEFTFYLYDSSRKQIKMEIRNGDSKCIDSICFEGSYHEALTLLFFTRLYSGSGLICNLPTINDFKLNNTKINFIQKSDKIKVPAFSHPLKADKFEGKADWVGKSFAGMSGNFCGWVSPDDAAVVLRAEVKIFLGSVVIELESYERNGWQPADSLFDVVEK